MAVLERFLLVLILFISLKSSECVGRRLNYWVSDVEAAVKYETIIVDQSGAGNFTTIQSAIDAVPSDNLQWICIYVKTGIYKYILLHLQYETFFTIKFFV